MKLRMVLVTVLILCISIPAYSEDFAILSGTISGVPAISAGGSSYLGLKAIETSGANLGNEIKPVANGPYGMALFTGTYDLRVTGGFSDNLNGQYTSLGLYDAGYPLVEDVVITGDTNRNIALPIYGLTGVITDTEGTPIRNVRLEYNQSPGYGNTITSSELGSEGTYKIYFVPGTYTLTITPPAGTRFSATTRQVTISGSQGLDIELEAQNLLSGTISGVPAISAGGSSYLGLKAIETSGANLGNEIKPVANGPYGMALFTGTYDLRVTGGFSDNLNGQYTSLGLYDAGYPLVEDVVITGDTNRNIALPIYGLTGVITDTEGTPIRNVRLEYNQSPGYGNTITSSELGSEGTYKIYFVPGTYTLTITPPAGTRFSATTRQVTISGSQGLDIELEAQNLLSGTISGVPAISAGGSSYLGLKAIETSGANLGNEIKPVANGPYGMALFTGTYDLRVTGGFSDNLNGQYTSLGLYDAGYPLVEDVVITGDTNRNIALPIYGLTGVITDTEGTPIRNVRLEYNQSPGYGNTITSSELGSEGTYKIYFVPGTYALRVSAPPEQYPPFEIKKLHILGDTVRTIILSDDYTVLEEAIEAIPSGLELHFDQFDVIDQDQAKIYEVPVAAPRDQLELIVNWEGSVSPGSGLQAGRQSVR